MQTSYGRHRYSSSLCARQLGRHHHFAAGRVRHRMVHRAFGRSGEADGAEKSNAKLRC
jgi:hypothetical protein